MASGENNYRRPAREQRRVVITGLAAITPVGNTAQTSWEALINGRSGIDRVTQFDPTNFSVQISGEVKDFPIDDYVPKKDQKKMHRFTHFALGAAHMALADSGLELTDAIQEKTGAITGVGIGGLPLIESQRDVVVERGPSRITPFFIPAVISNMAAGHISIKYGAKGPNYTITSACASGAHAIGEAAGYIRNGFCDVMFAGGTEGTVCPLAIGGFAAMKALSTRNDNPQAASRPWDRDRDGFVLSEGCGMFILEEMEHAVKRGARIYGELTGYGFSSDGFHMTNPIPGGAGASVAMKMALRDAMIDSNKIDYINAHGTSTPAGDQAETEGIKSVFGDHAYKLWVSSTKSMIGHTLGAAGAVESVIALQALHHGIVPPTINLDNPSPENDLDYVPHTAREKQMHHVMNNSFGFGGTNASLIFSRFS
ncbi:MAG: beta-ketoacyl-ACP synthase II [Bdellovibrionaceae bacterium]|nr:beta-ketoacyl-ACP synthase II [Bdellovibrionales bacterium]MCB9083622.1 beta-ketoacyl-ACP synthase II [Pseudobdellovibrionaceae bacterium]